MSSGNYFWNGRELVACTPQSGEAGGIPIQPATDWIEELSSGVFAPTREAMAQWIHPAQPEKRPHLCPVCGGRGSMHQEFYEPLPPGVIRMTTSAPVQVPCRACGGAGYIIC